MTRVFHQKYLPDSAELRSIISQSGNQKMPLTILSGKNCDARSKTADQILIKNERRLWKIESTMYSVGVMKALLGHSSELDHSPLITRVTSVILWMDEPCGNRIWKTWNQKINTFEYKHWNISSLGIVNIARIANAVQVTIWLSVNHPNRCLCSHCSQLLLVCTSVY